jgi:hypothetical protein
VREFERIIKIKKAVIASTCDEKFSNVNAAASVDLTAAKYGRKTFALSFSLNRCVKLIVSTHTIVKTEMEGVNNVVSQRSYCVILIKSR